MAAIDKSIYEIFEIETPDGRTADISAGVIGFSYFENLFSPYLTAKVIVTNTGTSIENDKGVMTGIYNGLPLRGGEKLRIKIAGNSKINGGMDFSDDEDKLFYVASITNVILEAESESFTLNLVSREALSNETSRVGKKFPSSQKISDSVRDIIKNYLKSPNKINVITETSNPYGFIGNMKKPFTLITWLASKSVSSKSKKSSTAGFLFFETQQGYNFMSIDDLIDRPPFPKDYAFTPGLMSKDDPNKDFKILQHSTNFNQDLIGKLERGAYASVRYYINPVSFKPNANRVFKANDYVNNTPTLGERIMNFFKFDKGDKDIGDLPSRIFTAMLDVGTIERDADDKGWDDASERNADPARIHAQSMMMYNNLFNSQVIDTLIPLNSTLTAGNIIRCEFPRIDRKKRKEPDPELSGLYMIKELCHYFDSKGSYTKLKLVRDTFGRK
tara:strand:+ start:914 stop:2245 length:1332 start_codon:yes stop_codon:yes gene_type:complete